MSKILLLETDHMRSQIVPLSYHEQEKAFQKSWNPSIFKKTLAQQKTKVVETFKKMLEVV